MASNKAAAGNVAVTARPTAHGSGGRLRVQYPRGLPYRFAPATGSLPGRGRAFFPSSPVRECCFTYLSDRRAVVKGKDCLPVKDGVLTGKGEGKNVKFS